MTRWIVTTALFTLGGLAAFAAPVDEITRMKPAALEARAKAATTAADHLEVARQYELRAADFEAKAEKHDEEAAKLAARRGYNPMAQKWPAMANGPTERARSLAMQARRAASEALTIAARHRELAKTAPAA